MGPGFVSPHISLEFLAKAGMFHPQLPNLAGKTQIYKYNIYTCNYICFANLFYL